MRSPLFPMLALAGLALVFPPTLLPAQTVGGIENVVFRFDGFASGDELGSSVACAGDVDRDGIADLIVGAYPADPNGVVDAGSAFVFSGATGALLRRFDGQSAGEKLGISVAGAGDVDGDGFADLIVGAPFAGPNGLAAAGSAFVFSGASGAQIFRFDGPASGDEMGTSVAGCGDVNGDGVPDLIVGANNATPDGLSIAGSAFVFSGATGAPLFRFDGPAALDFLGFSVAGAGDVDGDGFADLVVGAPLADPKGLAEAGSAFLFSGKTGAMLFRFDGPDAGDQMGFSVADAGDVDGDGFHDPIIGAVGAGPEGLASAGSAFVFSGATGAPLFRFDGQAAADFLGGSVSGAGDVDGDGFGDLIVGARGADPNGLVNAGSAFAFSGATGAVLFRFDGRAAADFLGQSVAGAGEGNGSGFPGMIVGASGADPNGLPFAGSAFVFTFNPILTASGEVLSVTSGGTIDYAIDFPVADAGAGYKILISASGTGPTVRHGLAIPLTPDHLFRASFLGNTPSVASGFQGTLDAQGDGAGQIAAPPFALPGKLLGRRAPLHLAVVNSNFDFSSVARTLRFTL